MPRPARTNSGTPSSASSRRICSDRLGWDISSALAAALNEPCSAAERKYVSCWSVIGFTYRPQSQSSLKQCDTSADNGSMFITLALIVAFGVGTAFAAEDRPGFDERSPLS